MPTGKRRRQRTAGGSGPDPIDIHVGGRVRLARELAGLTQVGVGKALGMSFQVVQKYEQGSIRVSASRLFQLARLVGQPVSFFFDALGETPPELAPAAGSDPRERELLRAWRRIARHEVRQRLLLLVRGAAALSSGAGGGTDPPTGR